MEIGVHLPQFGNQAGRNVLLDFAPRMEVLGYDSCWVSDHVVVPRQYESRYPYHAGGHPGGDPNWAELPLLEPLATLLFVAVLTQRVKLGTSVLVVPMRNPVLLAKMLATLDILSGGRLILGVGAGWLREEFEALAVPFDHRGARLDEYLTVIRKLWTDDDPSFAGRYYCLGHVACYPKPLQRPCPPIWIGGNTDAALRRAAWEGDAWHAVGATPDEAEAALPKLQAYAKAAGRNPAAVPVTVRIGLSEREGVDTTLARLQRYQELGVTHLCLGVSLADPARAVRALEWFAESVRPRL